ncbi:MAG: rhodanese-like domain-containing protein [Anaerolineae bacterium]|nr:rhodanese-like domain-containing protein [Anaerolineae bacterium]
MWKKLFGLESSNSSVKVQNMSVQELHQRLQNDKKLLLLDVRTDQEYRQDGHIAKTRHIPLSNLAQQSAKLPKDRTIVCICRSGNRSRSACQQLANEGFTEVINLSGGMIAWRQAGLPVK